MSDVLAKLLTSQVGNQEALSKAALNKSLEAGEDSEFSSFLDDSEVKLTELGEALHETDRRNGLLESTNGVSTEETEVCLEELDCFPILMKSSGQPDGEVIAIDPGQEASGSPAEAEVARKLPVIDEDEVYFVKRYDVAHLGDVAQSSVAAMASAGVETPGADDVRFTVLEEGAAEKSAEYVHPSDVDPAILERVWEFQPAAQMADNDVPTMLANVMLTNGAEEMDLMARGADVRSEKMRLGANVNLTPEVRGATHVTVQDAAKLTRAAASSGREHDDGGMRLEIRAVQETDLAVEKTNGSQSATMTSWAAATGTAANRLTSARWSTDATLHKVHDIDAEAGEVAEEMRPLEQLSVAKRSQAGTQARLDLPHHVAAQLSHAIRSQPNGPVEVALQPEELGRVKMVVTASDTGVVIAITADRPETFDMMRRHAVALSKELMTLGFGSVDLSFQQGSQPGSNSRNGAHSSGHSFDVARSFEMDPDTRQGAIVNTGLDRSKALDIRI